MALPAAAQLEVGDNWSMNLSGDIGYNYHGNISDGLSGHSMGFAGDANLTGSYYNPNFLNFNVQPYYDRTQSNSVLGALTNTSGVNSNVNLFSGSHFPGSFSYSKGINSVGRVRNTRFAGWTGIARELSRPGADVERTAAQYADAYRNLRHQ